MRTNLSELSPEKQITKERELYGANYALIGYEYETYAYSEKHKIYEVIDVEQVLFQ